MKSNLIDSLRTIYIFSKKKYVSYTITFIIVAIVGFFFYRSLSNNWERVQEIDISFDASSVLSILLFSFAVIISGLLWGNLLRVITKEKSIGDNLNFIQIHTRSWLLKYIPGQVGSFMGKLSWGINKGISKQAVSISFLYENIFLVISSAILSLPILFFIAQKSFSSNLSVLFPLLFILPLLLIFTKEIFYKLLNTFFKNIFKKAFDKTLILGRKETIFQIFFYFIPRLINALGFILIVNSIVDITFTEGVIAGATYILAGVIGLLAFFVPSGIGVRETVIVLFLGSVIGTPESIIASVLARFYIALSDLVLLVYLIIFEFFKQK